MDEFVDLLDAQGHPTGQRCLKSEAHAKGLFHPTVHIWLYTPTGRVVVQQRGRDKETFPLYWDVSVAGHVAAGEPVYQAAIREVEEEVGLTITEADLQAIGVFKRVHQHTETLIDAEFHHIFLCALKVPFATLTKQDSEVEALSLVPLSALVTATQSPSPTAQYVPHGTEYYQTLVKEVEKRL